MAMRWNKREVVLKRMAESCKRCHFLHPPSEFAVADANPRLVGLNLLAWHGNFIAGAAAFYTTFSRTLSCNPEPASRSRDYCSWLR